MRRMAKITTMTHDDHKRCERISLQIEEHLHLLRSVPHYQIELDKERHLDVMTVNVETTNLPQMKLMERNLPAGLKLI